MSERGIENRHLDLQALERYLEGTMEEWELARAERHLEGCPICRIELGYLKRFRSIDEDEELLSEARWEYAEKRLEQWRSEFVKKARAGREETGGRREGGFLFIFRWSAPVVAAAVLILMFIGVEQAPVRKLSEEGAVMRGGPGRIRSIELIEPYGKLSRLPEKFVWRQVMDVNHYDLEIFSSQLRTIFKAEGIADTSVTVTDSLRALIEPGTVYLWKVTGYKGNEPSVKSGSAWFEIKPGG